jgi:multicomponent Na+:H+ antiporter subunit C
LEPFFAIAFGVIISMSTYLLLSRNVLRMVLGLLLLGNGVNLSIFVAGRMGPLVPPILAEGQATLAATANPLPQALILTAIVISFALTAFTVVLFERAYRSLGTLDTDAMRVVEPRFSSQEEKDAA